ncbi:hypothetical protein NP493_1211g00046 [Ridgeia piscesae]|uniref:Uncharacterized protein n=1 Tax=Ridgeia piscesae TaxID=27915 RepID=A0AAD9KCN5_RIDPI|nr:hypothetical protein NP493_1211g00046 [Ridgeia piscesae]
MYNPYSSHSYASLNFGNPLYYLCGSNICYMSSGVAVLVVGVIITSVTFQNLQSWNDAKKEGYVGPVLIGAGLLLMGRGVVPKISEGDCHVALRRHWHAICRTFVVSNSGQGLVLDHMLLIVHWDTCSK